MIIKIETDENMMIKDFKDIIQDNEYIILEGTQQLLDEINEVQSNKYINEVQGLGDILKEMQMLLDNSPTCNRELQVVKICDIKDLY